jgi:hypothetical protein
MHGHQIAAVQNDDDTFRHLFGSSFSILLVRPDGYVAFAGNEGSIPQLAKYCDKWLVAKPLPTNQEDRHAG